MENNLSEAMNALSVGLPLTAAEQVFIHREIELLRAACKWLISEAYWFQCEGGWDDPEYPGHDVRPEAIRPIIDRLCKEMWPKPLLPPVKQPFSAAGDEHG